MTRTIIALTLGLGFSGMACAMHGNAESPLSGTWILVAADKLLPNGSRQMDYGEAPKGLLIIDSRGRYSLQILKSERANFAANDKKAGTAEEFAQAVLGSSTHFGRVSVDEANHTLTFRIDGSSFPNWEGREQKRAYELVDGILSYKVPARPNGEIPVSVWQKQ